MASQRQVALLAAAFGALWACAIGLIVASNGDVRAPGTVPRAPTEAALFAAPAVVGALGAIGGRRVLLVAAGLVYVLLCPISFAALPFLAPAILFLRAGVAGEADRSERAPARPLRLVLGLAAGVPIALLILLTTGVFGMLLVAVVAAIGPAVAAHARRGVPNVRLTLADALLGIAVAGLLVGGAFALFATTRTVCWNTYATPNGAVYQQIPVPVTDIVPVGGTPDAVGGGCDSGALTIEGLGLAAALVLGAVTVAARASLPAHLPPRGGASSPA
jgi:hypothetical protein